MLAQRLPRPRPCDHQRSSCSCIGVCFSASHGAGIRAALTVENVGASAEIDISTTAFFRAVMSGGGATADVPTRSSVPPSQVAYEPVDEGCDPQCHGASQNCLRRQLGGCHSQGFALICRSPRAFFWWVVFMFFLIFLFFCVCVYVCSFVFGRDVFTYGVSICQTQAKFTDSFCEHCADVGRGQQSVITTRSGGEAFQDVNRRLV